MSSKLIIIRGYPASGKSTLGAYLQDRKMGIFVDHNTILNAITAVTKDDDGLYETIQNLELTITEKLLRDGNNAIVARGFTSLKSFAGYLKLAASLNTSIIVIRLDVPVEELQKRASSASRQQNSMSANSSEEIRSFIESHPMESFDEEVVVDGTQATELIWDTLKQAFS